MLWAIVLTPVLAISGGTWWLATHMATKDDLKVLDTKVQSLDTKLQVLTVDVAVLKDRTERAPAPKAP